MKMISAATEKGKTMSERQKLIQILSVHIYHHELADPTEVVADYLLDNDVVPVVRCKDCIHCMDRKRYLRCVRFGFSNGHEVRPDGFCCYGEKTK